MSCLDNTDILRIVGGNSFQIAITVKARRVADGSEIEDFDLSASSPVLNLIHAGEKTRKYFVTQGNQAIISFDGSEGLGYYGMEMSGSYNSEAWRFCIEKVLQLVDTNAKANIPEWSVLVDDTYFIEGTISIYGGGGGGDTVQADWTETNPTSAAFILHKPDLSVYATKTEVASGLAGKQDTIVDLTSIRYGAAAGATAYQKPVTGIPESDMSDGVQSALEKAEDAYQLPANGIPATDMDSEVQTSLARANSAVQTETDPVFSNSPAAEITQADINNWNAKQSAIADLSDIREGAAAGATAVQPDEMAQAIDEVDGDIADINAKIPAAASNLNQLADKAYVNSSIATNSATYRGSFNLITDLGMNVDATHTQIAGALATAIVTADNNDYAFVQIPDSASTPTVIAKIERYKHNGSGWVYEYDLNNSGFTAAQWAAINSGITSGLVGKLADLPNNSELATLLNGKQNVISDLAAIREGAAAGATAIQPADLTDALNGVEAEIAGLDESKQDTIEDLSTIRSGAAAGATAYQKPGAGIPESDMSEGVQSALDKAEDAYKLPANGIPATDMDSEVQAALEKANSAVQTETDPVFSNSPAAEISQTDINNWNAKQSAIADLADIREGAAAGATAVQPDEMAQAIDEVDGDIDAINAKIPAAASNLNQLADKAYVNSSIATNSATYRGSFNLITDLGMNVDATHAQIAGALATAIVTADNNDYAFVQIPDSASTPTVIAKIERYKHNGSGWVYEYDLNNSGFTAAQWAAINSGITSGLVGKLSDLPNNSELATLLNGKQNVINDLSAIRSGAAAGATAYQKPSGGIPASDMSSTVQQELSKANTAVQTETDPIFSASPAAGITDQNIQTWNGEPAARQAADALLQTAIQNEATARATADALLQQQYNALTQSDIIVGALPASGVPNIIYRVPGTTDFTDYMWYDNQFIPMATYGLPISAEFVVDENLNKTQEEVNQKVFELDAAINGESVTENLSPTWTEGQAIIVQTGGTTNATSSSCSGKIDISKAAGGTLTYTRSVSTSSSSTVGMVFYTSSDVVISGQVYKTGGAERDLEETVLEIPNNAAYVRFSCFTELLSSFAASITYREEVDGLREEVDGLISDVNELSNSCDLNSTNIAGLRSEIGTKSEDSETVALEPDFANQGYVYADDVYLGQINSNSTVNKYSNPVDVSEYQGGSLTYTKNASTSPTLAGLVFYKDDDTPIVGYLAVSNAEQKGYVEETVTIPTNASYARFTFYVEFLDYFSAVVSYTNVVYTSGLGQNVQENTEDIEQLQSDVEVLQDTLDIIPEEYTEVECRRRFYEEMTNWFTNRSVTDVIIEGPSGYGLGGEVANEILGRGRSSVPINGIGMLMAASMEYEPLSNIWQHDTYTIKTKGVERNISIARSLDNHYGSVIEAEYVIVGWKTGSNGGLTNLEIAVSHPLLEGNILVGVMSRNYEPDTESNNRSLAMKYLLDIGLSKYQDRSADVSSLQSAMLAQHAVKAIVFICPKYPAFMHKWDLLDDSYHLLYTYSENSSLIINPMSMIKLLTAIITIDYTPDLDDYITVTSGDITAATGGTGAIFAAGERVTYRDLLCALLMPSSNQAGYVLARNVGKILLYKY